MDKPLRKVSSKPGSDSEQPSVTTHSKRGNQHQTAKTNMRDTKTNTNTVQRKNNTFNICLTPTKITTSIIVSNRKLTTRWCSAYATGVLPSAPTAYPGRSHRCRFPLPSPRGGLARSTAPRDCSPFPGFLIFGRALFSPLAIRFRSCL